MDASSPWWASGLFTLAGVLITAIPATTLAVLNRRAEHRRLSRAQKTEAYPQLLHAASRLTRQPIWPAEAGSPSDLHEEIDELTQRIHLFAPDPVRDEADQVLTAAAALADTVTTIRTTSEPAHGDLVDQRDRPRHQEAVDQLRAAAGRFLSASRVDLEVDRR